jgi:hypothetical protein
MAATALRLQQQMKSSHEHSTSCLSILEFSRVSREVVTPPAGVEGGSFLLMYARDLAPSQHNIHISHAGFILVFYILFYLYTHST